MVNSRREKILHAVAGARQILGQRKGEGRIAKSPLNRLRGIDSSKDTRDGNLLSRTTVRQRPVYDTIADKVLGNDDKWTPSINLDSMNKGSLAEIASTRITSLRERNIPHFGDDENLGNSVGLMADGRPIWEEVLDNNRGYAINQSERFQNDKQFIPDWPSLFQLSTHKTWQSWHVIDENARASLACEKVVERPGGRLNPILITGDSGCGRSHLLHATAQGMLRRRDGNVHFLSVSTMTNWEKLPKGWQDAIPHAILIAIDDLNLANTQIATELGMMIDLALNHGVQVIATAHNDVANWDPSRLTEVMRSATSINIELPSFSSLVTHLRKAATGRSLLLDDHMIARIVSHSDGDWRSADALFEKIALVIEAGEEVLDAEDVTAIIVGSTSQHNVEERQKDSEHLEDLASQIVGDALDHVFTESDYGGVEIHSELPQLSDDWEVPDVNLTKKDDLHSKLTSEALTPHVDTTITVDEAEEYLIHSGDELSGLDKVRARETTAGIDELSDELFEEYEKTHLNEAARLAGLEEEMIQLAELSQTANTDELIDIADRLKVIESELSQITVYDEYVPEGEWNIDSEDIDMGELLERQPIFSSLNPVVILLPDGEEE